MTLDTDEATAKRVLAERRAALQAELESSAKRALDAHQALIELIAKDDALRQAIAVIAGESIEPESHIVHRLTRIRGRLESLTDDLETITRLANRRPPRPAGLVPAADPPLGGGRFLSDAVDSASSSGTRDLPSSTGRSVEREAVELARQRRGVVRVRDLAERVYERYPGRFASPRSAYASISAQLERSDYFVKADRGEFLLVGRPHPPGFSAQPDEKKGGQAE